GRKYGSSISEVIAFGEEARRKLEVLEQRDSEVERINAELAKVEGELVGIGNGLTAQRCKLAPQLSKAVVQELNALGFRQSCFDVAIQSGSDEAFRAGQFGSSGFDTV